MEIAPSAVSSSDAFNMQQNLYFTVMFFQLHPFPTAGIPYFARLNKNTYYRLYIKLLASCLTSVLYHTIANILCIRKPATGGLPGRRRSPLHVHIYYVHACCARFVFLEHGALGILQVACLHLKCWTIYYMCLSFQPILP